MKMSTEEDLYALLNKILHISQFFKIENFEADFQNFLLQINEKYFRDESI